MTPPQNTLRQVTFGIDIGGTNTAFGIVDRDGNCLADDTIPTLAHEPITLFLPRLYDRMRLLWHNVEDRCVLQGIGIGAPSANYYTGTIEQPPNLNWGQVVHLKRIVEEEFAVPVALTNDANAAALGEMLFGAARGMKHFIIITLGTGLGSGIVVNGDVLYGADGFAGELGHTIVDPNGRMCGCGRRGCLETYVSASGIRRTVLSLLAEYTDDSIFRRTEPNAINAADIARAALAGDVIAHRAFEQTGELLGRKLADVIACFSPEAIILFGGLAASGDLILAPTQRAMEENTLHIFKGKTTLLVSSLMNHNAAVLGAAALIWKDLTAATASLTTQKQ